MGRRYRYVSQCPLDHPCLLSASALGRLAWSRWKHWRKKSFDTEDRSSGIGGIGSSTMRCITSNACQNFVPVVEFGSQIREIKLTAHTTSILSHPDIYTTLHFFANKLAQRCTKTGIKIGIMFDQTAQKTSINDVSNNTLQTLLTCHLHRQ